MSEAPTTTSTAIADMTDLAAGPTKYTQVAISDWLAVGASQPIDASTLYVSGNQRIDGSLSVQKIMLQIGGVPSTAQIIANGEPPGQLGITGSLRVQDTLKVGIDQSDNGSISGQLVVRGEPSGSVPIQLWQETGGKTRAVVDARGRLGVGTATPEASLTIQDGLVQPLQGTVSGEVNVPLVTGTNSKFLTELRTGDWISIPAAGASLFQVTVQSDTTLTVSPVPKSDFTGATAYRDGDTLVRAQNGHGDARLTLGRRGDLSIIGGVTADGPAQLHDTLQVSGGATLGGLTVTGASSVAGLTASGTTTLAGVTANGAAQLNSTLAVSGTTTMAAVAVSGAAQLNSTLKVTGASTLGSLAVTGNTDVAGLTASGPTQLNSTLKVTGATTLGGGLAVTGNTSVAGLAATGATTLAGVTVSGAATVNGGLTSTGNTTLASVTASGAATLNGGLSSTGNTTLGAVTVSGAATVNNNLTVSGTATVVGLQVPGATETLRMIRGSVNVNRSNGTIVGTWGTGYTVARLSQGLFRVTFSQFFTNTPSASVTQVYPEFGSGSNPGGNPGNGRDNAVIYGLTTQGVWLKTSDPGGNAVDRSFTFLVNGPR